MTVLEERSLRSVQQSATLNIRSILLATDFSNVSERAGAYAKALALHFDSGLQIANIFDPSVVTSYEEAIVTMTPAQMKEISRENLESFARNLKLDGVDADLICVEDHDAPAALLQLAHDNHADLIVAGTEAKSGLSRLILGSTAERILRSATCPVLTVGPRAETPKQGPLDFRSIVYATDLSWESIRAASIADALAEESAAHLYCCCVLSANDEGPKTRTQLDERFMQRMKRLIPKDAYDWCQPEFVVEHGEAAASILNLATKVNADLIVLGVRRASFWLTRVEGGLTPALLAHAKCPVLTVC